MSNDVLTIEETSGAKRSLVTLNKHGRSIPHNLPTHIKQREHKTHYPGSTRASVQALGPSFEDMHLEGRFDDRYLSADTASRSALETRALIEGMVARGRKCELVWGDVFVEGLLLDASFTIQAVSKIDYKLTFSVQAAVVDDDLGLAQLVQPRPDLRETFSSIQRQAANLTLRSPQRNFKAAEWTVAALKGANDLAEILDTNVLANIRDVSDALYGSIANLSSAVDVVLSSVDAIAVSARKLLGVLGEVRSAAIGVLNTVAVMEYETVVSVKTNVLSVFAFEDLRSSLATAARGAILGAAQMEDAVGPLLPEWIVHIVIDGQTLQSLARRYWGDSDGWQMIADDNEIRSGSLLQSGQVLLIRAKR